MQRTVWALACGIVATCANPYQPPNATDTTSSNDSFTETTTSDAPLTDEEKARWGVPQSFDSVQAVVWVMVGILGLFLIGTVLYRRRTSAAVDDNEEVLIVPEWDAVRRKKHRTAAQLSLPPVSGFTASSGITAL
eukprot:TRINITY_DN18731_c0_g1_i1.p1 TRINITY_DN18731_c0_g1~~TRINITY_DN18731_c0_g1_i1.p1  ORF type:complete len:135 (+),score=27.97 TRINITY_DN18731_c0_g1_i1:31-435(+)